MSFATQAKLIEVRKEDDKHVREVIQNLKNEEYTQERLQTLHKQASQYERERGGSRGNRIVIRAVETLLPLSQRTEAVANV